MVGILERAYRVGSVQFTVSREVVGTEDPRPAQTARMECNVITTCWHENYSRRPCEIKISDD